MRPARLRALQGGGILHSVHSFAGRFSFTFTGCRKLLPDPDFYRDCLEGAVRDIVASASEAVPGTSR